MKSPARRSIRPAGAKKKKPAADASVIPSPAPREKPTQFFLAAKMTDERADSPLFRRRHE